MKYYKSYMDRQEASPELHEKLLQLEPPKKRRGTVWTRYGTLAACAALIIGLGMWRLAPGPAPAEDAQNASQFVPDYNPQPGEQDTAGPDAPAPAPAPDSQAAAMDTAGPDLKGENMEGSASRKYPGDSLVVSSPRAGGDVGGKLAFPMVPFINYQNITDTDTVSMDWCWAKGTFRIFLTREDIQTIFWGPEGKPEADYPKTEQGDLPWMLFWDGYTIRAHAWYSPEGKLLEVFLTGERGESSFELRMYPGQLPTTCLYDPDVDTSEVFGTEVTGWSRLCDWDGDGQDDYICGSEFITRNDIGIRFENRGSSLRAEYTQGGDMDLGGVCTFNALFVRWALAEDGGPYLDHLLTAECPDDPDGTW